MPAALDQLLKDRAQLPIFRTMPPPETTAPDQAAKKLQPQSVTDFGRLTPLNAENPIDMRFQEAIGDYRPMAEEEPLSGPRVEFFYAQTLASTSIGTNQYKYTWIEVFYTFDSGGIFDGGLETTDASRSSTVGSDTYGHPAYNLNEALNTAALISPGIDADNLPSGWVMKPYIGIVTMKREIVQGQFIHTFTDPNVVDGACP